MKRIFKLAISALYWFIALLAPTRWNRLVILYYHSVPDKDRDAFAKQLDSLARFRVVSADFTDRRDDRQPLVAITFDDAFKSVIENALPELAARGMPFTIFAPSAALGRCPEWQMEPGADRSETLMDVETLRSLPRNLVSIGSHTASHPRLSQLPAETAQSEISGSKAALEALTDRPIDQLAFPYGDYDEGVVQACRLAGYAYVYSIDPVPVNLQRDDYVRGRVQVEPHDWPLEFFLKSRGAYAWMPFVSAVKRRLVARPVA
jgi:peptidoglycan/xylan/chitin deacetylase (PgdA/CDA1 family)